MVHSEYEEVSVLDCLFVLKLLQQHHFLENAVSMVYGNCYRTSWLIFSLSHSLYYSLFVRKRLFNMINDHPSVCETMFDRKQRENKPGVDNSGKSRHSTKVPCWHPINLFALCQIIIQLSVDTLFYFVMQRSNDGKIKNSRSTAVEDGYEDDEEHSETLCGTCSGLYNSNEFWIGCDICERWFHGKCVRITPAKADQIKQYKCPDCSKKSR